MAMSSKPPAPKAIKPGERPRPEDFPKYLRDEIRYGGAVPDPAFLALLASPAKFLSALGLMVVPDAKLGEPDPNVAALEPPDTFPLKSGSRFYSAIANTRLGKRLAGSRPVRALDAAWRALMMPGPR